MRLQSAKPDEPGKLQAEPRRLPRRERLADRVVHVACEHHPLAVLKRGLGEQERLVDRRLDHHHLRRGAERRRLAVHRQVHPGLPTDRRPGGVRIRAGILDEIDGGAGLLRRVLIEMRSPLPVRALR